MKNKLLSDLKKTLVAEKIATPLPVAKAKLAPIQQADANLTDEQLLAKAMQGVTPLQLEATAPTHRSKTTDDNTLLRRAAAEGAKDMAQEAISDTVALLNPVASEAILSFRKIGIQQGLFKKLKDGHLPWRAAVDLHGCTVEQARQAVLQIIADAQQEGITVIKIVHGKGYSQGNQGSLLKTCVNGWLQQHRAVLAFHSATAKDGGNGAVFVLLKKQQNLETKKVNIMWHYLALLCCAICSLFSATYSHATITIDENFKHAALGKELSYFCDPSNQLSLEQVKQKTFSPVAKAQVSFGYNQPSCWFRFNLINQYGFPVQLVLSNNYNTFDRIDIFFKLGDTFQQKSIGDTVDYSSRELQVSILAAPIDLPARSEVQFYIRAQTTGNFYLPLEISTYNYFLTAGKQYQNILGIGYGIVIGLFLYHLFLFFLTKEKVQFFTFYMSVAPYYFLPVNKALYFNFGHTQVNGTTCLFIAFAYLRLVLGCFSRLFLNTKNNIMLHKWMKYSAIALALSSVFHIFVPTSLVAIVCSIFGILLIIALFIIALKRYFEGLAEATVFIIAWGLLLATITAMIIMMNLGMGNINIAMLLAQLAFAAQQILLSIGLAQRINSLKQQKEQKEKEAAIALAENQAKTDFLARMSHEIRTPMNAVIGVAQLLEATPLNDSQQHYINLLKNSGKLLLGVINDILDYAKITSGNIELEKTPFNLPKILSSTYQILSTNTQSKDIDLIFDIEQDIPQWIEGDPIRLQQVLFNLLSNAIKFTKQGEIRLQVKRVFQIDKNSVKLQIIISDTGIGLNKEQIKYIFSAFHQADASTTRKYGGTGLGLAISKQLIELMGGTISVNSQLGKGTQFSILLPVLLTQEIPTITNPLQPILPWGDFYQLKVLLTEDNTVNQLIISSLLKQIGIEADIASNGEEAFSLVSKASPAYDLVLMDCEMPILNGLEATKQIRAWEKHTQRKPVHIIALTAHALPEYQQRCLAAGMDDYLTKPLLLEQLMVKLLPLVTPKPLV